MPRGHGVPATYKPCGTCGQTFKVHASTLARGAGKYCSRACYPRIGAANSKWRGGRIVEKGTGRVIVYAPGHPNATMLGGNYIYEYRLVASRTLGRALANGEIVHHVNGDPTDNRPENLEVVDRAEHLKIHRPDMMAARREIHGF